MSDVGFYIPVTIGKGASAVDITLVKDYAGDLGDYRGNESSSYIDTLITTDCMTYVKDSELDKARANAPSLESFGAAQVVICNPGQIDFNSKNLDVYTWRIGDDVLYLELTPGNEPLDKRLRCHWGYRNTRPGSLRDLSETDIVDLRFDLTDLLVPQVPIRTIEEQDDLKKAGEKTAALSFLASMAASFVLVLLTGFISQQIDVSYFEKGQDLDRKIALAMEQENALLKTVIPPRMTYVDAIHKLTALYRIDPNFKSEGDTNSQTAQLFGVGTMMIRTSGKINFDPAQQYSWINASNMNTDGSYSLSFNTHSASIGEAK